MNRAASPAYALCMKGNIYTSQKCPACGGKMTHNERRGNCFCACGVAASGGYLVRFGREICKRFPSYQQAARFLTGLRFKTEEGSYDRRDYRKDQPLSFRNQAQKWLAVKEGQVVASSYRNLKGYMDKASAAFGDKNVKNLSYGDLEDFLFSKQTARSDKTRANIRSCLNSFFDWLADREDIQKPKLPEVKYELGWRAITTLETQQAIMAEVCRIAPAKVAFGIELLATYPSLRPDDLRRVTEGDYRDGIITIHQPTKRKNRFKIIRLLPDHAERWQELRRLHPAVAALPFFRHEAVQSQQPDAPYGARYFYKWWAKACANLGIEGLDLYGGTRHTTTTAIAQMAGHDNAKKASGHVTSKAFERYCQAADDTAFTMAQLIHQSKMPDTPVINIKKARKTSK